MEGIETVPLELTGPQLVLALAIFLLVLLSCYDLFTQPEKK